MGGSSGTMSVRAPDQDHDDSQFYFFANTPFPHGVSDASVHFAAHHASALIPAALVGQQWGWSGS